MQLPISIIGKDRPKPPQSSLISCTSNLIGCSDELVCGGGMRCRHGSPLAVHGEPRGAGRRHQ